MINWRRYFDRIYCIHHTGYTDRYENIKSELRRLGILDSGIFQWQLSYNMPKIVHNPSEDGTFNHLYCYLDALFHRYEYVLILEDDSVFLKDIDRIQQLLEMMPVNDLCLFDWYRYENIININGKIYDLFNEGIINDDYTLFTDAWLLSNYAVSRKCMEYLNKKIQTDWYEKNMVQAADYYTQRIAVMEHDMTAEPQTPKEVIATLFSKYKTVLSYQRMSLQNTYDNCMNIKIGNRNLYNINWTKDTVCDIPVDYNDYNFPNSTE